MINDLAEEQSTDHFPQKMTVRCLIEIVRYLSEIVRYLTEIVRYLPGNTVIFNARVTFSHCSMKLISLLAQGSPFLAVTRALSERNAWTGFVRLMIDPPGFRCLTRIGNREDRPIAGRQCRLCNWRSHVCLELSHHNLGLCEALVPSFYVLAEM